MVLLGVGVEHEYLKQKGISLKSSTQTALVSTPPDFKGGENFIGIFICVFDIVDNYKRFIFLHLR